MKDIDFKKRNLLKALMATLFFGTGLFCCGCSKNIATINHKKCVACRLCESVCPHDAIFYKNGKIKVDESKCTGCSECVDACVYSAIKII